MGKSGLRPLNPELISTEINSIGIEKNVFSIWKGETTPSYYLDIFDDVMILNPDLVIYAIDYKDLGFWYEPKPIPSGLCHSYMNENEFQDYLELVVNKKIQNNYSDEKNDFKKIEKVVNINPKRITIDIIKNIFNETADFNQKSIFCRQYCTIC
jgi:hypothetical protein